MRLKALLVGAGAFVLIVMMGMRPDSLPFIPRSAFSDVAVSHYPSALFLRETVLQQQKFPLWNETILAGQPFAANPLNKTAYPLQWLVLLLPAALHINVMIALHLLIAGCGLWMWARALGMRQEAAAFSAFAYAFAPRIVAHTGAGHIDVVYAMAWFPWLMWAISFQLSVDSYQKKSWSTRLIAVLQIGIFAAMVLLADVRVGLFAFATAGVYALTLMLRTRRAAVVDYLAAGVVALALSIALIVPLVAWSPYLSRAELSVEDASVLSMRVPDLISLIVPANGVQHEQFTYFGLPVLLLAGIALSRQAPRQRWLWLAAILLVVLYALGSSGLLWTLLVRLIPALLWFRVPARAWLILALLMPLLAGWGFQYVSDWTTAEVSPNVRRWRLVIFGALVLAVGFGLASAVFVPFLASGGVGLLLIGVPLGIVMLLLVNRRLNARQLALALGVLLFVDVAWTSNHWAAWRAPEAWLTHDAALAERLLSLNPQRIYSPTYSVEQQVAAAYGLRIFGGVDPFQLSGIVDAIEQGSGVPVEGYQIVIPPLPGVSDDDLSNANRDAIIDTAVLGAWGVSHVVAAYPLEHPQLRLVDTVDGVYIYENTDAVRPLTGEVPDWVADWQGLPSADEVRRLNDLTLTSVLLSALAFVGCVGLLVVLKLRSHV